MMDAPGALRIGELGRRVGASPELLRAWERRYGLLQPSRSAGGFRLYSARDEERVRSMQRHLANGLAAAQAARAACRDVPSDTPAIVGLAESRVALLAALERYDEPEAQRQIDSLLGTFAVETVMSGVLLPLLATLGERWDTGAVTVAEEHFASALIRGRLLAVARGWGRGQGPLALLASPPGEQHDIPLLMFGIALRQTGWRIAFLGADTPMPAISGAANTLGADVVVLSTIAEARLREHEHEIVQLARRGLVAIGGPGATSELAAHIGATYLEGNPVDAATALSDAFTTRPGPGPSGR